MSTMSPPKLQPLKLSARTVAALKDLTPEQVESAIMIAAKLLAIRSARAREGRVGNSIEAEPSQDEAHLSTLTDDHLAKTPDEQAAVTGNVASEPDAQPTPAVTKASAPRGTHDRQGGGTNPSSSGWSQSPVSQLDDAHAQKQ